MPHTPSNELLGFVRPTVKAERVEFGLRIGGGIAWLHTTKPAALDFARELAAVCGDMKNARSEERENARPSSASSKSFPSSRLPAVDRSRCRGLRLAPEVRAQYIAAYADFAARRVPTKAAAARKHGLPVNAWGAWCVKNRAEIETALKNARPERTQEREAPESSASS
jgi:hypothetical protein